ncbi:MAG: protein kinase, partial [Romboutsia sp.]|nr:protein kinase [Romboutsia sp.]
MANFLEVYNSVKLIENKDRKIICTGINIKNNKKVIIKLYKESDYNENDFIKLKSDVKLCRQNKDNNIINIYSIGTATYNNSKYYTVELEYIEGRSLKQLIEVRTFEEIEALEIISQIINELKILEIENIKFKNLSTESILLDKDGLIKLDLSEDVLSNEEKNSIKNNDSQIYLLGLILYELITNEKYDSDKEGINKETISAGLYSILEKCLNQDLTSKYNNIDEILSDLDINKLFNYEDEDVKENDIHKNKKRNAIKAVCICVIAVSMYTGGRLANIPVSELLGHNKSNNTKVAATTVDSNKVSKVENDIEDKSNEDDNKLDVSSLVSDLSTEDNSDSNKNESTTNSSSNKNNSSSNNSNITQKPSQNQGQSGSSSPAQKP